jgi:hypothetical protein
MKHFLWVGLFIALSVLLMQLEPHNARRMREYQERRREHYRLPPDTTKAKEPPVAENNYIW